MMKNARIAARLGGGFGAIILLLILLGVCARLKMGTLAELTDMLYLHPFTVSTNLLSAEVNILMMEKSFRDIAATSNTETLEQLVADVADAEKKAQAHLEIVTRRYLGNPADVAAIRTELENWKGLRDRVIELARAGKREEAIALQKDKAAQQYAKIEEKLAVVEDFAAGKAASFVEGAKSTATSTYLLISILLALTVAGSVAIATLISRSISRPLNQAVEVANRITEGDLKVALPSVDRHDEVGDLFAAFDRMIRYLRDMAEVAGRIAAGDLTATVKPLSERDILGNAFALMIDYLQNMAAVSRQVAGGDLTATVKPLSERDILGNAFAGMLDNLRNINRELGSSVTVLASSASEILASTTQIASGMVETATSVSETTATVEEVKQTAQLSAEKSRNVSDIAMKAVTTADQGTSAVAETMAGIDRIKELMESVAESVVLLSEQTQAIGEIITVVNDLAQQSNLLAVNAAIEASKAGEQGRGFAVVAQEIKSLADQSKQATEQVRTILADIQKATGKSVLAAEQVSKAVESGVNQAADSGESIRILAESIGESSQAAAQIAVSSQQQLAGMEQVAMAMESIKMAAQQNVAGTKQVEQAAQTLNELGQRLKEMMKKYRV